ncbi:DsbA family protein [Streptomyces sp. NPDC002004]
MNENNREGNRSARDRLAAERERSRAKEKRRRGLIVGGAVVGVLALAAVIGVIAANAGKKGSASGSVVAPSGATGKDSLVIPVGRNSAKTTLTIWEDFRCPVCKQFESAYRPTVHELVDKGLLKVEYHFATLIDGNLGGSGSLRAANAAACAQEAGKFRDYHDVLYENQPPETTDGYGDNAKLIDLAGKVGGLSTDAFKKCVQDGTHDNWVAKSEDAFRKGNFEGTPTVLLNGKDAYRTLTPQKLKQTAEAAAQG